MSQTVVIVIGRLLGGFAFLFAIPCIFVLIPQYDLFLDNAGLTWAVGVSFFLVISLGLCSWVISWLTGDKWWRNELEKTKNANEVIPPKEFDWFETWHELTRFIRRMFEI